MRPVSGDASRQRFALRMTPSEITMKKMLFTVLATATLLSAAAAAADDLTGTQDKRKPNTGITLCFGNEVANIALLPEFSFVESAIIIYDVETKKEILKANTTYGDKTTGSYWTSKLPQNITLKKGCYRFHLMTKPTPPTTSARWVCAAPRIDYGPVNAGDQQLSTLTGTIGAGALSHVIIFPDVPNKLPEDSKFCPEGR